MGLFRVVLVVVLCLGGLAGCSVVQSGGDPWTVERVHDGDTLWVERAGVSYAQMRSWLAIPGP